MKKSLLLILLFSGISIGQEVLVLSNEPVTSLEQGKFFYPQGNIDDSKIIFSSETYKGLWMRDNNNGMIEKLNDYNSAGYEPIFTADNKIIHRKDDFKNNRRFISIYEYNLIEKRESIVEKDLRGIAQIKVNNDEINYSRDQNLLGIKLDSKLTKSADSGHSIVMIENSDLVIYGSGERKVLNPLGDGNYLWASVSPDGTRLVFTYAGKGSFITDLNGEVLARFSEAHYPQWSPDGKWILFMRDYDDGEKIIESDLFISSNDGKREFKITDSKETHEMYPVWAKSENALYYNSSVGVIYKIELKFN